MQSQEALVQEKINAHYRNTGKYPTTEMVDAWRREVASTYFHRYCDEDYR